MGQVKIGFVTAVEKFIPSKLNEYNETINQPGVYKTKYTC